MPQAGWRDPANGQEKTFEEWLEEARTHGEALGLPYEVLLGISRQLDKSDRPEGFSATMLSKCARAVWLDKEVDYFPEPQENYAAFRGTIGHAILEGNQHPGALAERRIFRMYRGEILSGQLDTHRWSWPGSTAEEELAFGEAWLAYCQSAFMAEAAGTVFGDELGEAPDVVVPDMPEGAVLTIDDWKTKDKVPFGIYVYDHHKKQGNTYRWLARVPRDKVRIRFIYVSMTEVKTLHVYNGGKFANGRERPMQVMTDDEFEAYLDDRLRVLALQRKLGRPLPYAKVPAEDLWECNYCPIKSLCYKRAAEEARAEWEKGNDVDRITPRDSKEEGKVRLPKAKKAEASTDEPAKPKRARKAKVSVPAADGPDSLDDLPF